MKPISVNREILLVTTSSFAQRPFCETESPEGTNGLAPAEQLEAACWNGLMSELLPEILSSSSTLEEKIFLWQVETRTSYLKLNLGASNPEFERQFTIDPGVFVCEKNMN